MNATLIKKLLPYAIIVLIFISVGSYFAYINADRKELKQDLENKKVEVEVKKDEIKTESFEAKWEATEPKIKEYNYEITEKNDSNDDIVYTIEFFRLQSKENRDNIYQESLSKVKNMGE